MKIKYIIKQNFKTQPDVLEQKVIAYLASNCYKIVEKGVDFITFEEDRFSERTKRRSDLYDRIGEGRFTISCSEKDEVILQLTFFTSISYYIIVTTILGALSVYTKIIIMPIIMSICFALPIFFRVVNLKATVFEELTKYE